MLALNFQESINNSLLTHHAQGKKRPLLEAYEPYRICKQLGCSLAEVMPRLVLLAKLPELLLPAMALSCINASLA
jgi:hypothetical protein